jgi:hypothetical protein
VLNVAADAPAAVPVWMDSVGAGVVNSVGPVVIDSVGAAVAVPVPVFLGDTVVVAVAWEVGLAPELATDDLAGEAAAEDPARAIDETAAGSSVVR